MAKADNEADQPDKSEAADDKQAKPKRIGNRWAAPAMIACAVIGLAWIVVYYAIASTSVHIPWYSDLKNWNLAIGMGFIMAAFLFAMKWE